MRKWPSLGDWVLAALVMLVFLIVMGQCGCKSSRPVPCPEPEQEIVIRQQPVPCIVPVALLADLELPTCPPFPHDGDEAEEKAWAIACGEAIEEREAILLKRDEAWRRKVEALNNGTPLCSDVDIR